MDSDDESTNVQQLQQYLWLLQQFSSSNEEENSPSPTSYCPKEQIEKFASHPLAQQLRLRSGQEKAHGSQRTLGSALRWRELCGRRTPLPCQPLPNQSQQIFTECSALFCARFSENGETLLTACQDRKVKLWSMNGKDWKCDRTIMGRDVGWAIVDVALSPCQRWFVYSSWSSSLHLCNLQGDPVHLSLPLNPSASRFCLFSIKFGADNKEILGGSSDRRVYVYDLERSDVKEHFLAHSDDVNAVCWAHQDSQNIFVSGGDDCLGKVWDRRALGSGKPVGMLVGHWEGLTDVASKGKDLFRLTAGDGRYILTNGKDHALKLWDLRVLSSHGGPVHPPPPRGYDYRIPGNMGHPVGSTPSQRHAEDTSLLTFGGHAVFQTLVRCAFSPPSGTGQRFVYSGSYDGAVYVWDLLRGGLVRRLKGHGAALREAAWHPWAPLLVSVGWDGRGLRWDWEPDACDTA